MNNSFNYVISSKDRINQGANPLYYDINFGGLNTEYDNFYIEVLQCNITSDLNDINDYLVMTCKGLNENGIFCPTNLNADECILCTIPIDIRDTKQGFGGISFRSNNCRMLKTIRITFLTQDMVPVIASDVNTINETQWILTLRMTPIIN